jgi:hypothetical protein
MPEMQLVRDLHACWEEKHIPRWRPDRSNGKLVVSVYYNGRAVIGVPERVRFTYPKDSSHLGDATGWVRFRVTSERRQALATVAEPSSP